MVVLVSDHGEMNGDAGLIYKSNFLDGALRVPLVVRTPGMVGGAVSDALVEWIDIGPTLIEFFTYRAEGHSTSDDPGGYRSAQERSEWPLGDPVMRLKNHLIALGEWDEERQEKMDLEAAEHVKKVTKEAEANGILGHGLHHPFRTMFEDVFEELPWHLREQAEQAIKEREIKFPEGLPK